jgi:hypothetical protein
VPECTQQKGDSGCQHHAQEHADANAKQEVELLFTPVGRVADYSAVFGR